jgi:hypothetical protein
MTCLEPQYSGAGIDQATLAGVEQVGPWFAMRGPARLRRSDGLAAAGNAAKSHRSVPAFSE